MVPYPSRPDLKVRTTSRSIQLKLAQVLFALGFGHLRRRRIFQQNGVFEDERIHFGREKTAVRIGRCADDRFAANVEAGVHYDGATRLTIEHFEQPVVTTV